MQNGLCQPKKGVSEMLLLLQDDGGRLRGPNNWQKDLSIDIFAQSLPKVLRESFWQGQNFQQAVMPQKNHIVFDTITAADTVGYFL